MTLVKQMAGAAALGAAMVIGCGLSAPSAWAGYIVTLTQQGSNVVATGSGPIDLIGLSLTGDGGAAASVVPSFGSINTGPPVTSVDQYMATGPIGGPTSFGSGGRPLPTLATEAWSVS
jgi:hypothetical protein